LAGIYLHIPFCKQACHYCDFHFSTNTTKKNEMVEAIQQELLLQKDYLSTHQLDTIYFGGGTPSLLSEAELSSLLDTIHRLFAVDKKAEITLEANPDDLDKTKLQQIKSSGVNRLSIGIQSFYEPHLKFLNRAHTSAEAEGCVLQAQEIGLNQISIDLIYAIPYQNHSIWHTDLQKALALHPQHISSYCLTIEDKTVFGKWLQKGKLNQIEEDFAAEQFEILLQTLADRGYEQYEISNFCLPNQYSRHNSNYWRGEPYLGVGPGAHSFNGSIRQFNVSNNALYLKSLAEHKIPFSVDELSKTDQVNELIMTGLRTKWGCNLQKLQESFQYDLYLLNKNYVDQLIAEGQAVLQEEQLILTNKGKLLADRIASDLFVVEEIN